MNAHWRELFSMSQNIFYYRCLLNECVSVSVNKSVVLVNGTINGSRVTTPSEEYY